MQLTIVLTTMSFSLCLNVRCCRVSGARPRLNNAVVVVETDSSSAVVSRAGGSSGSTILDSYLKSEGRHAQI